MIDKLRADLLESRKSLEINLIWMFVARQTYAASENRKRMLKMMKRDKNRRYKKQLHELHRRAFHYRKRQMGHKGQSEF